MCISKMKEKLAEAGTKNSAKKGSTTSRFTSQVIKTMIATQSKLSLLIWQLFSYFTRALVDSVVSKLALILISQYLEVDPSLPTITSFSIS